MEKLTKNFLRVELQCPHCQKCNVDAEFMNKLQKTREIFGRSMKINSGYRCAEHNAKVGGAKGSQHMLGIAADVACTNIHDRAELVKAALQAGMTYIIIYPTWVHMDCRPSVPAIMFKDSSGGYK